MGRAKAVVRRGRPVVYAPKSALGKHITKLVKEHTASGAVAILNAKKSELRNAELVPSALGISMPTVLKIAKANGVKLHRGRPALAA